MSLKTVVENSINKHYDNLLHTSQVEELTERIVADLTVFLRPELIRLIISMVPMEHMDSFLDDRINHLLED